MTKAKKAKKPTKAERAHAIEAGKQNSFEHGRQTGFRQGYESAKADLRTETERLRNEERAQMFKALTSLGRLADQLAGTGESIAKMVLSLNGHL